MKKITQADYKALQQAKRLLERPGLTSRIAEVVGKPVERGFEFLPEDWKDRIGQATRGALLKGMNFAVTTLGETKKKRRSQDGLHKLLVAASGAGSGALGVMALPIELPVSTCLMLRSIADIARSEGHNVAEPEVKISCMEVLALGHKDGDDDAVEGGYWTIRAAMARAVSEASAYIAERGIAEEGAPPLVRFIVRIASRFGVVVSETAAAKAIPVVGAFGGATINYLFMDHFQKMAKGHFIVRRLEAKYGQATVQENYKLCPV